uniref:Uncharacterized protein n=1 Tax=Nothoprocta perdicaria TaxID=30464 RepID=A0A8C6ZWQ4_NOTPE
MISSLPSCKQENTKRPGRSLRWDFNCRALIMQLFRLLIKNI